MVEAAQLRAQAMEETRSMFRCQICTNMFSNDLAQKMPHMLQCQEHSICRLCVEMMLRNNLDYRCEVDHQVSKWTSWTFNLNQYLLNLMTTHLYLDLLTPDERVNRGKAIKTVTVKGLLPLERTKVSMMRHGNEGDLIRKVAASTNPAPAGKGNAPAKGTKKGAKNRNVRFKDGAKQGSKQPTQQPTQSAAIGAKNGEEEGEEGEEQEEGQEQKVGDQFPYDYYIKQLVEGMNEDDLLKDPDEWQSYRAIGFDRKKAMQAMMNMKMPKSALTGLEDGAGNLSEPDENDPFAKPSKEARSKLQSGKDLTLPPILSANPSISTYMAASGQIQGLPSNFTHATVLGSRNPVTALAATSASTQDANILPASLRTRQPSTQKLVPLNQKDEAMTQTEEQRRLQAAVSMVERKLDLKPPLPPNFQLSQKFEQAAQAVEKEYQCIYHPLERVKFYCPDCRQAVCPDCLPKHKAHPFVASSHEFREQKLAEVKELRNVVQTRQNELMDFIVKLKERKKEMKKNQALQKGRLDECFGEIRKCLDFYQQQAERILTDQFSRLISGIKHRVSEAKMKAAYLEEQAQGITDKVKNMKGWIYDRYLIEAPHIDEDVAKKGSELNELAEIQMRMSKDGPVAIKFFNLKSTDVVTALIPMFEESRVFTKTFLKSDKEQMHQELVSQGGLVPPQQVSNDPIASAKHQLMNPNLPPSGVIHYFRWGTKEVYQLSAPSIPQQPKPGEENVMQTVHLQWTLSRVQSQTPFPYFMSQVHVLKGSGEEESGVYLLGGQAEDSEQYSNQVTFFEGYQRFLKKTGMRQTRAFFPTIYYEYESSLYVFGGRNETGDLGGCEKYSILMNRWFQLKDMPTYRNGCSAIAIDQYIFVIGGNSETLGQLDLIEQYFINYDKWDTLSLRLHHKVSDCQIYPLYAWSGVERAGKDFRILIVGGNTEDQRVPPMEIVDLKHYIFESTEDRILSLLNHHYRESLRDPIFGTMTEYGEAHAAIVKRYCDQEPTSDNIIILNLKSLAQV